MIIKHCLSKIILFYINKGIHKFIRLLLKIIQKTTYKICYIQIGLVKIIKRKIFLFNYTKTTYKICYIQIGLVKINKRKIFLLIIQRKYI